MSLLSCWQLVSCPAPDRGQGCTCARVLRRQIRAAGVVLWQPAAEQLQPHQGGQLTALPRPVQHSAYGAGSTLSVHTSAISTLAPSMVPMMRQPFIWNFMLEVPEASVPAVEMCWDSSAAGMMVSARLTL